MNVSPKKTYNDTKVLTDCKHLPSSQRVDAAERKYAESVALYAGTDLTIRSVAEVAQRCNVSRSGFRQFLRFYHKDILEGKAQRRKSSKREVGQRKPGELSGNGNPYGPKPETVARYAPALELYRTSPMTIRAICDKTGVSFSGFKGYMHQWHNGEKKFSKDNSDNTNQQNIAV